MFTMRVGKRAHIDYNCRRLSIQALLKLIGSRAIVMSQAVQNGDAVDADRDH